MQHVHRSFPFPAPSDRRRSPSPSIRRKGGVALPSPCGSIRIPSGFRPLPFERGEEDADRSGRPTGRGSAIAMATRRMLLAARIARLPGDPRGRVRGAPAVLRGAASGSADRDRATVDRIAAQVEAEDRLEDQLDAGLRAPIVVRSRGMEVLHNPWLNKGTAFSAAERERLGLRGLLPTRQINFELQKERIMRDYHEGEVARIRKQEILEKGKRRSDVTAENIRKWKVLQELQDRNETLFYKVLVENFVDMAPIVYTPTVGWACRTYSKNFRRPRGMFFSAEDRGHMSSMIYNWPAEEVDAVVVTDGSRVLGLGDLGMQGLGICIGKLDIYVAAAGFHPMRVLPCVIDVGTNNKTFWDDPFYMGIPRPRLEGEEYHEIIDEFVHAVLARYPHAVVQFEDFQTSHAHSLLERYRHEHLVFNDDIQGTAATALAGLVGGLKVRGLPPSALVREKIVLTGAGSAGIGVATQILKAMEKHGLKQEDAARNFWILDKDGLITRARPNLPSHVHLFARSEAETEGMSLLNVVKRVRPTCLMGLSTVGGLFTDEVLTEVGKHCEKPMIFPMSNPTSSSECTAENAQRCTQGRAIFASGSPFQNVELDGKTCASSQANNMYIFPGLALGAFLGKTGVVSDGMLMAASEALSKLLTEEELAKGSVYPDLKNIRRISLFMALSVMRAAHEEGRLSGKALKLIERSESELVAFIKDNMYSPHYNPLVFRP